MLVTSLRPRTFCDRKSPWAPPPRGSVSALGNSLVLHDNLDSGEAPHGPSRPDLTGMQIQLKSMSVFFFCIEGEAVVEESQKVHKLAKGDVIMLAGGYVSEIVSVSDNLRFMYVAIENSAYHPSRSVFQIKELMEALSHDPTCHLDETMTSECIAIYRLMRYRLGLHPSPPLTPDVMTGYVQALTMIVFSAKMQESKSTKVTKTDFSRKQDLYQGFMDELKATGGVERGMAYYADRLCVTQRYLPRIVKEVSGRFASEHIDSFVVDKAKQLLSSHRYTVLQVSEILEFSSHTVFTKYFRKQTGQTPSDYQKSLP